MGSMRTTQVKERPILMHARSIKGILAGRKTQARSIVKPQPEFGITPCHYTETGWAEERADGACFCSQRPVKAYADVGNYLWVRETWRTTCDEGGDCCVQFRADDTARYMLCADSGQGDPVGLGVSCRALSPGPPWKSSIHMPRWASRITLEITGVRVERVRDISAADAWAEGVRPPGVAEIANDGTLDAPGIDPAAETIKEFSRLWDDTNGKGAWDRNGWVWVIEFRKLEGAA